MPVLAAGHGRGCDEVFMIISSMTMMEKLGKNFQSHPGLRHASTSSTAHSRHISSPAARSDGNCLNNSCYSIIIINTSSKHSPCLKTKLIRYDTYRRLHPYHQHLVHWDMSAARHSIFQLPLLSLLLQFNSHVVKCLSWSWSWTVA